MQKILCALLSFFALTAVARADEIRLKDGSKIIGSIVGFEDGSFKVETSYGFAMIRKDSVSEIVTAEPKQPVASKAAPGKPAEEAAPAPVKQLAAPAPAISSESRPLTPPKPLVASEPKSQPTPLKPAVYSGAKTTTSAAAPPPAATSQRATARQEGPESAAIAATPGPSRVAAATNSASTPTPAPTSTPVSSAPATAAIGTAPAAPVVEAAAASAIPAATPAASPVTTTTGVFPAAVPAALPAAPPPPPPVREMVRGNLYINQTYGFEMYRAPDWQPMVAARAALPNAIAALGTSDQSTLLIIGREHAHDTLDSESAATEKMVQEIYENYRPMPATHIMVAGSPAIQRHFRGAAESRDWSVVLVTLERGGDVFTILAMTDANSELVQIQENVISKAVASLQFTEPHT